MTPEFDDRELTTEIVRLQKMLAVCDRHGEVDGSTAARAQLRALEAERAARTRG